MLTQDQKERLVQLINKCEDVPLKNLIEAASKQWISGNVSPKRNDYGVNVENGCYVSVNNHSCLVSSAMIGEKSSYDPNISISRSVLRLNLRHKDIMYYTLKQDVIKKFDITDKEIHNIISLFDGESEQYTNYTGLIIKELYEILFL